MKKNNNRRGFTIVELVIVIAVIAILSAVLIPTFSGLVDKANASANMQKAKNAFTQYLAGVDYADGETPTVVYFEIEDDVYYKIDANGKVDTEEVPGENLVGQSITVIDANGNVVDFEAPAVDDTTNDTTSGENAGGENAGGENAGGENAGGEENGSEENGSEENGSEENGSEENGATE